jgi:hypothetical protein
LIVLFSVIVQGGTIARALSATARKGELDSGDKKSTAP